MMGGKVEVICVFGDDYVVIGKLVVDFVKVFISGWDVKFKLIIDNIVVDEVVFWKIICLILSGVFDWENCSRVIVIGDVVYLMIFVGGFGVNIVVRDLELLG